MNLQQLRYLAAIQSNGLRITEAARSLRASQLGFLVFEREGRSLARTTPAGEELISRANLVLREVHIYSALPPIFAMATAACCRLPPPTRKFAT